MLDIEFDCFPMWVLFSFSELTVLYLNGISFHIAKQLFSVKCVITLGSYCFFKFSMMHDSCFNFNFSLYLLFLSLIITYDLLYISHILIKFLLYCLLVEDVSSSFLSTNIIEYNHSQRCPQSCSIRKRM